MIGYLAGPINGCDDDEANGWRQGFMAELPEHEWLDPMVRDYRGREDDCVQEIVEGDMADIDTCDFVVAYCWQPSWGTAMELRYAFEKGKPIFAVVPKGMRVSPWLRYHAKVLSSLPLAKWAVKELAAA